MRADERRARAIVRERSGGDETFKGWCEFRIHGVCLGRAANWCHRLAEGQGGPWVASNGIAGCGSGSTGCHGWCHDNPREAWTKGWVVASWQDWATTPVVLAYRERPAILSDDGGVRDATDDELIACFGLGYGVSP